MNRRFSVMVMWFLYQIWLNTKFLHQEYCFKFYIGKKMYMWFTFVYKCLLFLFLICLLFAEKHGILSEKRKTWESYFNFQMLDEGYPDIYPTYHRWQ